MDKPKQPELTRNFLQRTDNDDCTKELLKIEAEYEKEKNEQGMIHLEKDGNLMMSVNSGRASKELVEQNERGKEHDKLILKDRFLEKADETFKKYHPDYEEKYSEADKQSDEFLNGYNNAYNMMYDDPEGTRKIIEAVKEKDGDYNDGLRYGAIKAQEEMIEHSLSRENDKSSPSKDKSRDFEPER